MLVARRSGKPLSPEIPLALVALEAGNPKLTAVNDAAARHQIRPGQRLPDARAILPELTLEDAEPEQDRMALDALAAWCGRYSPRVMLDCEPALIGRGEAAIALDITGCAHLFGGEVRMIEDIISRLARFGLTARLATADRLAAAWAWARYGNAGILTSSESARLLRALPASALRLDPSLILSLERLGLRTVGQVADLPHSSLLARFGDAIVARLEALFGMGTETFMPIRERVPFRARLSWAEPIGRTEDIEAALARLLATLGEDLEQRQEGARRVVARLYRIDGEVACLEVKTGRPVRDLDHLLKLFRFELDGLDIGFGVEFMVLEAQETSSLSATQNGFIGGAKEAQDRGELDLLIDQLAARLGSDRVLRLQAKDSHLPERAVQPVPAHADLQPISWLAGQPRPLRMLPIPEPVQALAAIPDSPPFRLDWRGYRLRLTDGVGPERILPEWWSREAHGMQGRDYFRVTDLSGRQFWLYRDGFYEDGGHPQWRLHGFFA